MKDIIISERHLKRELWVFVACLAAMEALNIYAIIKYDGMWIEALKSLGFVFVSAAVTYLVVGVFRLIYAGIAGLINKTKSHK